MCRFCPSTKGRCRRVPRPLVHIECDIVEYPEIGRNDIPQPDPYDITGHQFADRDRRPGTVAQYPGRRRQPLFERRDRAGGLMLLDERDDRFGFGWAFFQAFAMRDMAGGSYLVSRRMTFLPELLSMNLLMTEMLVTSRFARGHVEGGDDPTRPQFWFVMSMGPDRWFACAYPINWWLVANHMKHGMRTVRR